MATTIPTSSALLADLESRLEEVEQSLSEKLNCEDFDFYKSIIESGVGGAANPPPARSSSDAAGSATSSSEDARPAPSFGLPTKDLNILRDCVKRVGSLEKGMVELKENVGSNSASVQTNHDETTKALAKKADLS
jgi:hypothetical protein